MFRALVVAALLATPAVAELPAFIPGVYYSDRDGKDCRLTLRSDSTFEYFIPGAEHNRVTDGRWVALAQNLISLSSRRSEKSSQVEVVRTAPQPHNDLYITVVSVDGEALPAVQITVTCDLGETEKFAMTDDDGSALIPNCRARSVFGFLPPFDSASSESSGQLWQEIRIIMVLEDFRFDNEHLLWMNGSLHWTTVGGRLEQR